MRRLGLRLAIILAFTFAVANAASDLKANCWFAPNSYPINSGNNSWCEGYSYSTCVYCWDPVTGSNCASTSWLTCLEYRW